MVATGVPPHTLPLKVGTVCMITANLDPAATLMNGSRVVVVACGQHTVSVMKPEDWDSRPRVDDEEMQRIVVPVHLIPPINFEFGVSAIGVKVKRRQFPLRLVYAVTFNKSQGKPLDRAAIGLRKLCFAHGQLYVALSRVRGRQFICLLINVSDRRPNGVAARNVVHQAILAAAVPPPVLPAVGHARVA